MSPMLLSSEPLYGIAKQGKFATSKRRINQDTWSFRSLGVYYLYIGGV